MPKKSEKLTEMEVRTAQAADKDYKLYDENGLRLLVRKSGTKVWQLPYRFRNKSNIYTIGQYIHPIQAGYVGLKEARLTCYEIRGLLNQGIDPNANKKAKSDHVGKEKTTFEFLAREWHAKGVWVSKHAKNILKSLEEDVFSSIGQKQITEITRLDIVHVLEKIEARDACDVAKRVCQRCVAIFDYAITKGICDDNPAIGRAKFIRKAKSKARPFLKEEELPEFLQKLFDYHGRNYIQMAVHFLLLTFVRPGELRHAEWKEIDFERALWKIPAERMKMERDHVVPLSFQSLALLRKLHDVTGNNALLFPGIRDHRKPISDVTLTKVLQRMGYVGDKKIVPHGFRHTASTVLNEHAFNRDHIERQLAHVENNKVRGVYNHAEYLEDRRKMMQWWADYLDNIVLGGTVIVGKFKGRL